MGVLVRRYCLEMRKLYRAGALSADTAVIPESVGIKQNLLFRRMIQFGWVASIDKQHYYLVEEKIKKRPIAWWGITR